MQKPLKNYAFIDGQNLHLGTKEENWKVDHKRFRIYLREKYQVEEAYYFFGYLCEENQDLYSRLQKDGFIVVFKEHKEKFLGNKKGNVDTDMVFEIMKNLINEDFDNVIIVSGDGDYKKVVDYLIKKNKFQKILFPNKKFASSLYKRFGNQYAANLGDKDIRQKIEYKKEKGA